MATKHDLMQAIGEAMRLYGRANDVIDEIATDRLGINRTDGRLVDILEHSGPMTAGALATRAGLTTGAITAALDRLERVGLAHRAADPHDRRKVVVQVTPRTLKLVAEIWGSMAEQGVAVMDRYTVGELEVILDFLQRGRAVLEERADELRAATPPSAVPGAP